MPSFNSYKDGVNFPQSRAIRILREEWIYYAVLYLYCALNIYSHAADMEYKSLKGGVGGREVLLGKQAALQGKKQKGGGGISFE